MPPHSVPLSNSTQNDCKTKKLYPARIINQEDPNDGYKLLQSEQDVRIAVRDLLKSLSFTNEMNTQTFWMHLSILNTKNNEKARLQTHIGRSPTVDCKVVSDSFDSSEPEVPDTVCKIVETELPVSKVENDNVSSIWDVTTNDPLKMKFSLKHVFSFSDRTSPEAAHDIIQCIETLSEEEIGKYMGCTSVDSVATSITERMPSILDDDISYDDAQVLWLPQNSIPFFIVARALRSCELDCSEYMKMSFESATTGRAYITINQWRSLRKNPSFNMAVKSLTDMLATAYCSMRHSIVKIKVNGWVVQKVSKDCQLEVQLCKDRPKDNSFKMDVLN